MINRVFLIGRLVADPALRYTNSGVPVASFTLAVERPFKNAQGEKETDFIDVVAWRKLAELVANHLGKGRLVAVEGRLQIRSYDAQDGTKRKAAEVVADTVQFLDRPKDGGKKQAQEEPQGGWDGFNQGMNEDDVPF